MDLLLATGEHMSGTLVTMALHAQGIEAVSLTGPQAGIRTDTAHGRARIANIDPARMRREIERGRVVIVAGFQGSTGEGYDTRRSPRSGAAAPTPPRWRWPPALRADACEIYTDVEGIFTADPRVVPDAQLIPTIGYEEMLELAHQGAQVMQTRAGRAGLGQRRHHPGALHVQRLTQAPASRRFPLWSCETRSGPWRSTARWPRSPSSACPIAPASPGPSSSPWPTRASTWT